MWKVECANENILGMPLPNMLSMLIGSARPLCARTAYAPHSANHLDESR